VERFLEEGGRVVSIAGRWRKVGRQRCWKGVGGGGGGRKGLAFLPYTVGCKVRGY
jgi:hypothetical protein